MGCRGWGEDRRLWKSGDKCSLGQKPSQGGFCGPGEPSFCSFLLPERRVGRSAVSTWHVAEGLSVRQETSEAVMIPALQEGAED